MSFGSISVCNGYILSNLSAAKEVSNLLANITAFSKSSKSLNISLFISIIGVSFKETNYSNCFFSSSESKLKNFFVSCGFPKKEDNSAGSGKPASVNSSMAFEKKSPN